MGLGQFALSGILGALAQPGLEPGEGTPAPTLQLPDRHAELPGDGVDRLTPQQAQHHLVLACQAPALTGRERTSPNCLPCDGRHRRAALALAAYKPSRIDHRLSITFHPVCPPASRDNTVSRETAGSSTPVRLLDPAPSLYHDARAALFRELSGMPEIVMLG